MKLITTEVTRYHCEFQRLRAQGNKYVSNTNNISQIAQVSRYLTVKCKKIKFRSILKHVQEAAGERN